MNKNFAILSTNSYLNFLNLFLGVVNPTVKALELLEKLADERSRLLEEKLTADKLIQEMIKIRRCNL